MAGSLLPRIFAKSLSANNRKYRHGELIKYSRPAWLDISPVCHVYFVHRGKVIHVGEEDIDFDDFINVCSSSFQNCRQVLDALVLINGQQVV